QRRDRDHRRRLDLRPPRGFGRGRRGRARAGGDDRTRGGLRRTHRDRSAARWRVPGLRRSPDGLPGIRVLVADDPALVRGGFRSILETQPDIEVVGEAEDGLDAVEQAAQTAPDVVLMDIRMPRMDGIAATHRILAAPAPPKVLILTTFDLDDYVYQAL